MLQTNFTEIITVLTVVKKKQSLVVKRQNWHLVGHKGEILELVIFTICCPKQMTLLMRLDWNYPTFII